jgi:phage tail-like protein
MKSDEIARLLPEVYQRTCDSGTPLYALLRVMESLHGPTEEILAHLEETFDPYRTPERFVPFLAHWVDLDRFFSEAHGLTDDPEACPAPISSGTGRLRELIAAAVHLSQWRGTSRGLKRFLEAATGVQGFDLDEEVPGSDGLPRPYHLRVSVPRGAARHGGLIKRIVEQEKPAYVTFEIEFTGNRSGEG